MNNLAFAACLLALGFKPKAGAQFNSEAKPKSKGGEPVIMFEGYSSGDPPVSAVPVQRAFENCGVGRPAPEPYQELQNLVTFIRESEEIPPHIKSHLVNAIANVHSRIAASAIGLGMRSLEELVKTPLPGWEKLQVAPKTWEYHFTGNR